MAQSFEKELDDLKSLDVTRVKRLLTRLPEDDRFVEMVVELYCNTAGHSNWANAYVIASLGDRAVPHLLKKLESTKLYDISRGMFGLRVAGYGGDVTPIEKNLFHNEPIIRRIAIQTLRILRSKRSVKKIAERLNDENARVRSDAVRAIEVLRAREYVVQIENLCADNDLWVRRNVANALARIWRNESLDVLQLLKNDSRKPVRIAAERAFEIIKSQ